MCVLLPFGVGWVGWGCVVGIVVLKFVHLILRVAAVVPIVDDVVCCFHWCLHGFLFWKSALLSYIPGGL